MAASSSLKPSVGAQGSPRGPQTPVWSPFPHSQRKGVPAAPGEGSCCEAGQSQRGLDLLASLFLPHFFPPTKYRFSIVLSAGHIAFNVCIRQSRFLLSASGVKCD